MMFNRLTTPEMLFDWMWFKFLNRPKNNYNWSLLKLKQKCFFEGTGTEKNLNLNMITFSCKYNDFNYKSWFGCKLYCSKFKLL